jgi:hypothetical protein
MAILPALILIAIVLEAALACRSWPALGLAAATLGLFVLIPATVAGGRMLGGSHLLFRDSANFTRIAQSLKPQQRVYTWDDANPAAEWDALFLVERDRALAMKFLEENSSPTDTISSGLHRHDKIFINDISVSFLTQRRPATKWHQFDPGLQNTERIQRLMVNDLERSRPKLILRDSSWDGIVEPNDSALSTGVVLLDDHIKAHYQLQRRFGKIEIWGPN